MDVGLSPTYYDDGGDEAIKSKKTTWGSPVFNDSKRIFFPHHRTCDCNGSGIGCECCYTCSC
ncbi:hypothetical protein DM01DRAFT_255484 [Hesseltinella vesiculosa]|uniref:Uncharacterized protein n=1 Tax=Hesseltinella vesiculosa TaxID=101127 RepID=A0A1X2GWM0_9FUNG|nr:hypothetical protein DM01DRAFT_255484 [Hesseltinella vesiculosa]